MTPDLTLLCVPDETKDARSKQPAARSDFLRLVQQQGSPVRPSAAVATLAGGG